MIKIKENKITCTKVYRHITFTVRGQDLTYSYCKDSTDLDTAVQLESGDESILTAEEESTIYNLINKL